MIQKSICVTVVENICNHLKNEICEEIFEYVDNERAIKKLKSGKSTGFDYISSEMLMNCKKNLN